jgi:hypothetical protein
VKATSPINKESSQAVKERTEMALQDIILKARVNVALVRDARISPLDIGVRAEDGHVTLTGQAETEADCRSVEQVVRRVEGVTRVTNQMTCGAAGASDTAEMLTDRLLDKLEEEWRALPDSSALSQADYLRWALWMVYKFRIPDPVDVSNRSQAELDAVEAALTRVAGLVGIPKSLAALEMLRQAEIIEESGRRAAPDTGEGGPVATPLVDEEVAAAA